MTRLLLIRHAHVDTGTPPRLCGSLDLPLSPRGFRELEALGAGCHGTRAPDALYTSPLLRARQTADILSHAWRLVPQVEDGLGEIHCGRLEGTRLREIVRQHADLWARNRAQDDEDFTWPDGESYRGFRARILRALGHVAVRHEDGRAAVVTHAGVVAQVMGVLRGRPAAVWELDRPDPLSVTDVAFADGAPVDVIAFNRRDWC